MTQPVAEQVTRPREPRGIASHPVVGVSNRGVTQDKRGGVTVEVAVICCGAYDRDTCACLAGGA